MHVGIDASRATVARRTGTESYALHLLRAMLAHPPAETVSLYFRDEPAPGLFPDSAGVTPRVIPFPRLWTHLRLAADLAVRRPRPDVLFVPAHVVPVVCPVPAVVTVHDLGYRHFPDAHPLAQRLYLEASTYYSAHAAAHVIADSEATRRDLRTFYGVPAERVAVVYPGRDESLRPVDPAAVRAKYGLPERYLLHVGTLQPRKNLVRLMEAARTVAQTELADISLVLAGRPGWLAAPILQAARECGPLVRVLEYVPDEDLPGLYSGAAVFAFPSLFEGFGFPVLEAMACGTPVVCANTSSLPEVAGTAALLVDPLDVAALATALTRALTDPAVRAELVARGFRQVQRFTWARAADEVWAVLAGAASGARRR